MDGMGMTSLISYHICLVRARQVPEVEVPCCGLTGDLAGESLGGWCHSWRHIMDTKFIIWIGYDIFARVKYQGEVSAQNGIITYYTIASLWLFGKHGFPYLFLFVPDSIVVQLIHGNHWWITGYSSAPLNEWETFDQAISWKIQYTCHPWDPHFLWTNFFYVVNVHCIRIPAWNMNVLYICSVYYCITNVFIYMYFILIHLCTHIIAFAHTYRYFSCFKMFQFQHPKIFR